MKKKLLQATSYPKNRKQGICRQATYQIESLETQGKEDNQMFQIPKIVEKSSTKDFKNLIPPNNEVESSNIALNELMQISEKDEEKFNHSPNEKQIVNEPQKSEKLHIDININRNIPTDLNLMKKENEKEKEKEKDKDKETEDSKENYIEPLTMKFKPDFNIQENTVMKGNALDLSSKNDKNFNLNFNFNFNSIKDTNKNKNFNTIQRQNVMENENRESSDTANKEEKDEMIHIVQAGKKSKEDNIHNIQNIQNNRFSENLNINLFKTCFKCLEEISLTLDNLDNSENRNSITSSIFEFEFKKVFDEISDFSLSVYQFLKGLSNIFKIKKCENFHILEQIIHSNVTKNNLNLNLISIDKVSEKSPQESLESLKSLKSLKNELNECMPAGTKIINLEEFLKHLSDRNIKRTILHNKSSLYELKFQMIKIGIENENESESFSNTIYLKKNMLPSENLNQFNSNSDGNKISTKDPNLNDFLNRIKPVENCKIIKYDKNQEIPMKNFFKDNNKEIIDNICYLVKKGGKQNNNIESLNNKRFQNNNKAINCYFCQKVCTTTMQDQYLYLNGEICHIQCIESRFREIDKLGKKDWIESRNNILYEMFIRRNKPFCELAFTLMRKY